MTPRFELITDIPDWSLNYLINGDPTGLDEEEIQMCENWLKKEGIAWVCPPEEDATSGFSDYPAFGRPCITFDCYCAMKED
jgi:hypothetical protein